MAHWRQRVLALVCIALAGCTGQRSQTVALSLPDPTQQYLCRASFVLGEPTRTFRLRTHYRGQDYLIPLGEALTHQVKMRFWTDAVAAQSGRPQPVVAVGFDARTATRAGDPNNDTLRIALQFQIFRPTGQSYIDIQGGQSRQTAPEAAAAEALTQALDGVTDVLVTAGICLAAP